jgi:hypothetical protein
MSDIARALKLMEEYDEAMSKFWSNAVAGVDGTVQTKAWRERCEKKLDIVLMLEKGLYEARQTV